jgi:hypothetical protein
MIRFFRRRTHFAALQKELGDFTPVLDFVEKLMGGCHLPAPFIHLCIGDFVNVKLKPSFS